MCNKRFSTIASFMRQCGKYGGAGEATDDKWRIPIACWITKATDTSDM